MIVSRLVNRAAREGVDEAFLESLAARVHVRDFIALVLGELVVSEAQHESVE